MSIFGWVGAGWVFFLFLLRFLLGVGGGGGESVREEF